MRVVSFSPSCSFFTVMVLFSFSETVVWLPFFSVAVVVLPLGGSAVTAPSAEKEVSPRRILSSSSSATVGSPEAVLMVSMLSQPRKAYSPADCMVEERVTSVRAEQP